MQDLFQPPLAPLRDDVMIENRLVFCICCRDSSRAVSSSSVLVVGRSSISLGWIKPFAVVYGSDLNVVYDAWAIAVSLCIYAAEHSVAPDFVLYGGCASHVLVGGNG